MGAYWHMEDIKGTEALGLSPTDERLRFSVKMATKIVFGQRVCEIH